MAQALREGYSDLFTIKAQPTNSDRTLIEGKFKSAHNTSERPAKLMANTFYALLPLADLSPITTAPLKEAETVDHQEDKTTEKKERITATHPTLHYNIQIHLPATKDVEVYNAIFKSLREHLLD
jgi:hypothetical protein